MKNILLGLLFGQLILLPLAHKWELDFNKIIPAGLCIGLVAGIVTDIVTFFLPLGLYSRLFTIIVLVLATASIGAAFWFFRDEERTSPDRPDVIVSPADGTIKYVKRIGKDGTPLSTRGRENDPLPRLFIDMLPEGTGYLVGIAMTFLDAHVTRAPMEGEVVAAEHVRSAPLSAKQPDGRRKNERMIQLIRGGEMGIGLIHIASHLVRRIDSYARCGDRLALGQKLGKIQFGSQVDMVIPERAGMKIAVNVGDRVFAGVTIVART